MHPFENVLQNVESTQRKIITLLTDFGLADGFVGVMKGVMLQIVPQAQLVDISHDLPPFTIEAAMFLNEWAYGYFPTGTVHLCVVDPGVGTSRRLLVVETTGHLFVAPDNGLLTPVIMNGDPKSIISITNTKYWLHSISNTFHGRDIFAPVAAHLARGVPAVEMGDAIHDPILLPQKHPQIETDLIVCHVVYIDRFGNLVTNLTKQQLETWINDNHYSVDEITFTINDGLFKGLSKSYGEKHLHELLAILDGYHRLEISMNNGNAAEATSLALGDPILIHPK